MLSLKNFKRLAKLALPSLKIVSFTPTVYQTQRTSISYNQFHQFSTKTEQAQPEAIHLASIEDWEKKVLANPKPVILDFYADWCGPCKKLTPKLMERHQKSNGKWEFAKCNVDEFKELAQAFQVNGIPAVYLLHEGEVQDHFTGLLGDKELDEFVKKAADLIKNKK